MLHIYFGGLRDERLGRLGYFAYWLLLAIFLITGGLLIGFGVGMADSLSGNGVPDTEPGPREPFGVPFVFAIWAVGLTALFAELNISAKRVRHIGLPGWPVTLAIYAVILLAAAFISQKLGLALAVLAWLALVLAPGGAAGERSGAE